MTRCRHCRTRNVNRPLGLCWTCYHTPGVRVLYPSTSKYAHRGVGLIGGIIPPPTTPTNALPGSPEKVAVLIERARRGESLWHPADAAHS